MSVIKAGTTLTTAYTVEADTTGALEFRTGTSATLAMSISASGVVTFPATTGFDIASANITNLTSGTTSATVLRSASGTITNLLATTATVSASAFFATASGSVGIGTASPQGRLHVAGPHSSGNLTVIYVGSSNSSNSGLNGGLGFEADPTNLIGSIASLGANSQLVFKTGTGGTEKARIDASGRFGVGVTPQAWSAGISVIQYGNRGTLIANDSVASYGFNGYYDGADKYIANAAAGDHLISGSAHYLRSAPSGTAGNALTWTNVLSIDRNASLALQGATSQSGTGITFPATQSASSNANTLDDYEEGTWTPSFRVNGSTTGVTYSSGPYGFYTKVGNVVTIWGGFRLSNNGSSTGVVTIGGIPFNGADVGSFQHPGQGSVVFAFKANATVWAIVIDTTSLFFRSLQSVDDDIPAYDTDFDNDTAILFTMTYKT